ncbi:type II secretion system F family protein [Robiginitomaculum antarcticum]|uniref:type II secretion system F family protein n=1 Tax=Robiginitomaculum antarcticum TaxID=437507 RepID=UPI000381D624|nr:type II secretion system F family protein [Robiginitomaculum antarcticum]
METFDYAAVTAQGRKTSGSISAVSARAARDVLRGQHLTPIAITPAKSKSTLKTAKGGQTVRFKHLTQATRQIAILIDADTPIEEALKVIAQQFEKQNMRGILMGVRGRVMEGARLSEALAAYPKAFPKLYCSMVASGEVSGQLPTVLNRLAADYEAAQAIRRKVLGAIIYPIILSFVALLVTGILMMVVVPKVVEQFDTLGQELPWLTKAVIALSDFLAAYGLLLGLAIVAAIAGFVFALRRPAFRLHVDSALLRLPLIGNMARSLNASRFARTASSLMQSGTPSVASLQSASHTLRNSLMRLRTQGAIERIREGQSISRALRGSGVFPPLVVQMVAGGETGGDVAGMFAKSADYLEGELDSVIGVFLALLEPLIIIFLAMVVLLIIGAIFMPILQLNSAVL